MPSPLRKLVLFDIDGTLISDQGASRDAFGSALANVYEFRGDLSTYDFSGRTDPQIARMILHDDGRSDAAIDPHLPLLWERYLDGLTRNLPGRVRALPGISRLLDAVCAGEHLTIALLTGNIERGARLKLGAIDLNNPFPFGAFGSDSARREELPPIAAQRAADVSGRVFHGRDIVIIGDSIYDVRCGIPHDATTIAIASGKTPAAKLRAENPHHFFESAEDVQGIMDAIRG